MKAPQAIEVSERTLGWLLDHAGLPDGQRRALKQLVRESAMSGRAVSLGQIVRCCPDPSAPPGQQMPCFNAAGFIVNYSQSNRPFGNCGPGGGAPPPAAFTPPPPPPAGPAPAPPPAFTAPPAPGAVGCYSNIPGTEGFCAPGQTAPPPGSPAAAPPAAPPAAAPPGPPPQQTIIDMTYEKPPEEANWTWVTGPFGMMRVPKNGAAAPAAAPARARAPEPVGTGTVDVSPAEVSRLLDLLERSLEAMCTLGHRARRCGATSADADAAAALSACLARLAEAAGPATEIASMLCSAKSAGLGATLTERQVTALMAFEECLRAAGVALPSSGPSVWEALVSVAIPAAGAVAIAL